MKQGRLKRLVLYALICLAFIGIGIVPGYYWGMQHSASHASRDQQQADESSGSSKRLQELPRFGSSAAAELLATTETPEYVSEIYAHLSDAVNITKSNTAAFLRELQRWQAETHPNSTLNVEPFIAVARDMLGYFRLRYSEALLLLLRQFSTSGALVPTAVNPDVLQQEIQQLLDVTNLNSYYAAVARGCGLKSDAVGLTEDPAGAADAATGVTQVKVTGRRLLQQQLHMSPTARRNRLTTQRSNTAAADFASLRPLLQHQSSHEQIHQQNTLMSAAAGATSLPVFGRQLSQHSQRRHMLQQQHPSNITGTLQDTLCLVPPSNWPFELPPDIGLIGCDDPKQRPYLAGFQPVELPVVFHCLRFPSSTGQLLLPAIETPQEAGQNLVSVANTHFSGSGIRFKLQEVRTDVNKFPYLLLPSLAKWQQCSINDYNPQLQQQGFDCLAQIAAHPSVVTLASELVINVIVSSSPYKPHCEGEQDVTCNHKIWGFVQADGPWFNPNVAKPDYQEGDSLKNWMWLRFTEFDVGSKNNANSWDAGGNTFAHELAHYLALMHTHEGGCNGATPGVGDAVSDTSVSQQLSDLEDAEPQRPLNLYNELQIWCTGFRDGAQPRVKDLKKFNSCPKPRNGRQHATDAAMDNVFNLMAYVPEACYMGLLTPGQIDRLQSMVARHRPRMMDAFKVV